MTFIDSETGPDTSNPIELYRFIGSLGTYAYSSANAEKPIPFGADLYPPTSIRRTEIILGDVTEKNELKVELPIGAKLVHDYGFDIPPPELTLELYRMHGPQGAPRIWFTGSVAAITMEGAKARLVIPSLFSAMLQTEFPGLYYQGPCNHALYSPRCGASREAFKLEGTVASLSDRVTIRVPEAASRPDQWLRAGELLSPSGAERRLIVDHRGDMLTLNYPFRSLSQGAAVTMYAGCDHTIQECHDKFNNHVNHLGFPLTPGLNPFVTGLR